MSANPTDQPTSGLAELKESTAASRNVAEVLAEIRLYREAVGLPFLTDEFIDRAKREGRE